MDLIELQSLRVLCSVWFLKSILYTEKFCIQMQISLTSGKFKMKVKVICRKFECRKDVHYKPKPGPVAKNATPRPSGWESNPRPLDTRPVLYH